MHMLNPTPRKLKYSYPNLNKEINEIEKAIPGFRKDNWTFQCNDTSDWLVTREFRADIDDILQYKSQYCFYMVQKVLYRFITSFDVPNGPPIFNPSKAGGIILYDYNK